MRIGSITRFVAGMSVLTTMAPAIAQAPLVTEEAMVDSPQAGQKLYVRNKHAEGMMAFMPERTVVFVQGATYPASTAFDLELGGLSWMDYIAKRGFDGYLLDRPGYGRTALPAGGRLAGPAILLQLDATALIPPRWNAEVHRSTAIILRRPGETT